MTDAARADDGPHSQAFRGIAARSSVVIINWNAKEYLRRCLASLATHAEHDVLDVVVADAGSYDGCAEMIEAEFPAVTWLQIHENCGFARANNRAATLATGSVLLFLNPDTEVKPGALKALREVLDNAHMPGIVGACLLNTDGSLQDSCIQAFPSILNKTLDSNLLRSWFPNSRLWGNAALRAATSAPVRVEVVSGACMMVRRELFEEVGGFPEEYFMYAEDVELSYRVSRRGHHNYYVGDAKVVHHGGTSATQQDSAFEAVMGRHATWLLFRRTRGPAYALAYRAAMSGNCLVRLSIIAAAAPIAVVTGASLRWRAALTRWLSVLRWCVGADGVTGRYYPTARRTGTARPAP